MAYHEGDLVSKGLKIATLSVAVVGNKRLKFEARLDNLRDSI